MPVDSLSLFADVPLDTPPLSPSRSPSSASAARSSVSSSNSSISLGEFVSRMAKTRFDRPISHESTETVDPHVPSRKFAHENIIFSGARERDIQEEIDADMEQDGHEDRGRSGYDDRLAHHQTSPQTRPSIPRQGSYSKRHSSFDTPREVPFPYGYLSSSEHSLPGQTAPSGVRSERSEIDSQEAGHNSETQIGTEADSSLSNSTSNEPSDLPPLHRGHSSASLPLPSSTPYSSLPPLSLDSPPRYENPRPAPLISKTLLNSWESGAQSLVVSPPRSSSLRPPITKAETSSRSPPFRSPGRSTTPPPLVDENDAIGSSTSPSHLPSAYDSRTNDCLPPPQKDFSLPLVSSSPLIPYPHAFNSNLLVGGGASLPPPQPPTILTPPPPLSADEVRTRAPYEPFLPRGQPPPDHTYIAVETVVSEYRLIVRLPGFQRDSITLAMRRRRILHVVADNWSDGGGHFERRISFGYDADLASVRAEFDGEILRIIIPRRMLPTLYAQPTT